MKELVSVVVPILNPQINPTEEKLLHHCLEKLAAYPLIFVTFEGADLSIVREHHDEIDVITFPEKYFQSRQEFGRLLLMEEFYERFNWSEFLLIHELNSWIVKDELYYWCKQGYDYLSAAPFFRPDAAYNPGAVKRLRGLNDAEKMAYSAGFDDGGLNLCRIERMSKTLRSKSKEAYLYRHNDSLKNANAIFWELEANRLWPHLRKPSPIVGNHFAQHAPLVQETNAQKLPFALTGITRSNIREIPYFQKAE